MKTLEKNLILQFLFATLCHLKKTFPLARPPISPIPARLCLIRGQKSTAPMEVGQVFIPQHSGIQKHRRWVAYECPSSLLSFQQRIWASTTGPSHTHSSIFHFACTPLSPTTQQRFNDEVYTQTHTADLDNLCSLWNISENESNECHRDIINLFCTAVRETEGGEGGRTGINLLE